MIHLGSVPASTTIYIPFTTYDGSTGASITCSGLAVTDVEIYKNGSVTQRSSDAGIALLDTDGIDFDGITGLHGFSIDLSDNTDAGFFAVGSWYWVVVSAITVDSQTVTFLAATFRIGPAEALTGHPKVDVGGWLGTAPATPTTSGVPEVDVTYWLGSSCATPTVAGVPEVDVTHINGSVASGSGTPDVNVVQISGDATAANNLEAACDGTGFNIGGGSVVAASVTGAVGSVTGSVGGNVTGTVASVVGAVGSVTGNVGGNVAGSVASVVGAVGSVTGNVGGNVTGSVGSLATQAKADVNAEVLDVLSTDTFAELGSIPAATSSLKDKLTWMFMWFRNKIEQTGTTKILKADNGTTTVATFTESDDGTTYTSGEGV